MKKFFVYLCKFLFFPIASFLTERIENKENLPEKKSFIIASNHINILDFWFIGNCLKERTNDLRFVAAMDNLKTLLQSGLLYFSSEAIVINRKKEEREGMLKKIMKSVKNEKIVILFPEGNTNRKKELARGKTGIAELALRTRVPIIPLGMERVKLRRIIRIGQPLYFLEEQILSRQIKNNQEKYRILLRTITDQIMQEISKLCQKPYKYQM